MVMDSSGQPVDVLERVSDDRAGANPERDLMRRELGAKINQALTKLTPRERMVFELKHYQGLQAADDWRDAEHDGRDSQEYVVQGDAEVAGRVGADEVESSN